jgi:DMSO reductase anchor subunit
MKQHGHTPLVVFTSLAIAGAGLVAVDPVLRGSAHAAVSTAAITAGVALQAIALIVSMLHLGRRDRAPLAARRVGRSALSNEILMAGAAIAASAALLALGWREPAPAALRWLAGALCAGFLMAIGLVYRIPGQLTWTGPAVLAPISAGGAFGAACIQALAASPDGVPRAVIALIAADAALFLLRWQEAAALDVSVVGRVAGPFWPRRHQWYFARVVLLDVAPVALLLVWPTPLAIVVAAAGLVVDRLAFYGLAVQQTTEREVERVDEEIRAASERPRAT